MSKRFLVSVATAALIIGTSAVSAQSPGGNPGSAGSSSGAAAPAAAGSSNQPSSQGAESGRGSAEGGMKSAPSEGGMKSTQSNDKTAPGSQPNQRAQDSTPGQKSGMSADKGDKAGKDMKAEGAKDAKDGNRNAADNKDASTTTGQAGAGAKLSGEQRTKITTVIKQQRIQPVTNVNFSISVGTRVPREVHFHPLPTEIISVYPDWRGYEFFLIRDQIVVVDPRSFEIVAVLDA